MRWTDWQTERTKWLRHLALGPIEADDMPTEAIEMLVQEGYAVRLLHRVLITDAGRQKIGLPGTAAEARLCIADLRHTVADLVKRIEAIEHKLWRDGRR